MREEVQVSLRQDTKRRGPLERSSALDTKQRGPSQVTVGSPVRDTEQKKTSSASQVTSILEGHHTDTTLDRLPEWDTCLLEGIWTNWRILD